MDSMVEEEGKENKEEGEEKKEESKEEKKEVVKKNNSDEDGLVSKIRTNPWMGATVVLLIVLIVSVFYGGGGMTGNVISEADASQNIVDFVKARTGVAPTVVSAEEQGSFYAVTIDFRGQETPLYVTKDGKYMVDALIPLSETPPGAGAVQPSQPQQQQQPASVAKSDKPKVELFVMTHCPFGTQAEKGFVPAVKALGDSVDAQVRFVHYFMHDPEYTETPTQVCIREEQNDKYLDYLECFLEDGDSNRCLAEVGVDESKLDDCEANNADGYYEIDSALSQGYGVRGSPTLVINGAIANSGRDAASMLNVICSAFNDAPAECSTQLSSAQPGAGFGTTSAPQGSAPSAAQC